MNPIYQGLIKQIVEGAISRARIASDLQHPGEIGRAREIFVRDILRPILPSSIGIGTGFIIDHVGGRSNQVDVILYDKEKIPPMLFDAVQGIFPCESVVGTVEVKSELTRFLLKKSVEAIQSIRDLQYHSTILPRDYKGTTLTNTISRAFDAVFAFSSDINETTELERLLSVYEEYNIKAPEHPIAYLCVVGRGFVFYGGNIGQSDEWRTIQPDDSRTEIIGFLTGVFNSISKIRDQRGRPYLGPYISDFQG